MDYFILKPDGEQTGTFSFEQIQVMLKTGFIGPDTRYWHEGITEWRPVDGIEESLNFKPPVQATPPADSFPPQKLPAALRAVPRPAPRVEKIYAPPVQPPETRAPATLTPASPITRNEIPAGTDIPRSAAPGPTQLSEPRRPRHKRIVSFVIYIIHVTLMALAIDYAGPVLHYVSDFFQNKITVTGNDTYALVDQSLLKSFTDDIQNAPDAEAPPPPTGLAADPNSPVWSQIGQEKASALHADEVRQRYLRMGKAEFIDPGTYRVLDYLDEKGDSTNPSDANPGWIAIVYKDQTVYVLKSPAPASATSSP